MLHISLQINPDIFSFTVNNMNYTVTFIFYSPATREKVSDSLT